MNEIFLLFQLCHFLWIQANLINNHESQIKRWSPPQVIREINPNNYQIISTSKVHLNRLNLLSSNLWHKFVSICKCRLMHDQIENKYANEQNHNLGELINKKSRASFGIWQLPLFNQLKPECANCESFSGIQGRRGLSTRISENLPKCFFVVLSPRDLLKYHVEGIYQLQRETWYVCQMWCMTYYTYIYILV